MDGTDDEGTTDELDWFLSVVAETKRAAGLPDDWGTHVTPLSPEEELEDAPPPPRLRPGMTTDELLPYGTVVPAPGGVELVVERVVTPPVVTPHGTICALDPMSWAWQGVSLELQLRGEVQPVEVAVLRHQTPRGVRVQGAVAVIGDLAKVTEWIHLPSAERLSIDKGCGAFVARDRVGDVVEIADGLPWPYVPDGAEPVEVDGVVVGALFDPGDGPYGYEMMIGRGRYALPEALLVDLHVLPR
jgi:hypothetical protein